MKRIISVLLLFSLFCSFTACKKEKSTADISCEEIIKAYENAGYTLGHHLHEDPIYTEQGICCSLLFKDAKNPDKDYIYINLYNSTENAEAAAKGSRYNIVLWLVSTMYGESRWLKSGRFGEIHYTTYKNKMVKPLQEVIK